MIKNQCENCTNRNGFCTKEIVYNGSSCSDYIKGIDLEKKDSAVSESQIGIDLEKHETLTSDISNTPNEENTIEEITSESLKQTTEIHGWLSFFLFAIIIGGLISIIYPIATFDTNEYGGSTLLALTDIVLGVMLFGVAIYTVYAFSNRKPNAVFLGKTYIIAVFASNLLCLFGGDYEATGYGSLPQILKSLIWAVIWFLYLTMSYQVEEVIPSSFRKLCSKDWYLVATLVFVPLLFIAFGVSSLFNSHEKDMETFMKSVQLSEDERTDGKVVFAIPEGFSCNKQVVPDVNIIVYNIENEDIASITLCSDYDSNKTESNYLSYKNNWEEDDAKGYPKKIVIDERKSINGYDYFYNVTKYDISGNEVYWRFIMMFDDASAKVCVISCYDNGYDDYLQNFLQSIRFK